MRSEWLFLLKISFFDYRVFTSLFMQMLIGREYFFETNSRASIIIDCGLLRALNAQLVLVMRFEVFDRG